MITISLDDENVVENVKAIQSVKKFGFSDEAIQEWYYRQLEIDRAEKGGDSNER